MLLNPTVQRRNTEGRGGTEILANVSLAASYANQAEKTRVFSTCFNYSSDNFPQ